MPSWRRLQQPAWTACVRLRAGYVYCSLCNSTVWNEIKEVGISVSTGYQRMSYSDLGRLVDWICQCVPPEGLLEDNITQVRLFLKRNIKKAA